MGLFDGLKIMGDIIKGGIAAAKAGFKLDELCEKTLNEYDSLRSDTDRKLYDEYMALKTKQQNETDQDKANAMIEEVAAAQVAYLNSFRKNPAVPEEFAAGITLAVAEFKKANNSAFEKIRDRLLAAAETEEERQEVLKAFEEEMM